MASRGWPRTTSWSIPIKVTILSPGLSANGDNAGARHSRRRGRQVPVVAPDRDREDRALFLPGAVLDGHHQGQVEHAGHRAPQLQGSLRRQRAAEARAAGAGRSASGRLREHGAEGPLRRRCTRPIARTTCQGAAGTCTRRCPRWRCGRPMPTSIWCAGASKASRSTS